MREPIALCFSGGKDSMLALHTLRAGKHYEVGHLITTVTDAYDRVSMHGTRRSLLRRQCAALGLPVMEVVVPPESSNLVYEEKMGHAFAALSERGLRKVAFGDILLEDLRAYREKQLAEFGLTGVFPLWMQSTRTLAHQFLGDGFRAITVCVYAKVLGEAFAGRDYDASFLSDLPDGVDPCGENGEFHTFVHVGPGLSDPISFTPGRTVRRGEFFFHNLLPT
ncbi:MAG: adenine nucleotide alpha hydrolase [Bacteroidota bacterium]|nr:adenine nucleotide alpha hydrolase [Bacteroidota bacterium]